MFCPARTIQSQSLTKNCGGKGLNQSIAIAQGENSIILYPGANHAISEEQIDGVLEDFSDGDFCVLQSEINCIESIMRKAHAKGMRIVLNPSPFSKDILNLPLELVEYSFLNEVEATQLTGESSFASMEQCLKNAFRMQKSCLRLAKTVPYSCMGKFEKHVASSLFKRWIPQLPATPSPDFLLPVLHMDGQSNVVCRWLPVLLRLQFPKRELRNPSLLLWKLKPFLQNINLYCLTLFKRKMPARFKAGIFLLPISFFVNLKCRKTQQNLHRR